MQVALRHHLPINFERVETSTCDKIKLCVYLFLQLISHFFAFHCKELSWCCQHHDELKRTPAFVLSQPSLLSDQEFTRNWTFIELWKAWRALNQIEGEGVQEINAILKRGFCEAQVLFMVKQVRESGSLFRALDALENADEELTLLQTLEIFRYTFEMHGRQDLLDQVKTFLPQMNEREQNIDHFQGLAVARIHDDVSSHSVLLIRSEECFGFYDPKNGFYEYETFDALKESFQSYAAGKRISLAFS